MLPELRSCAAAVLRSLSFVLSCRQAIIALGALIAWIAVSPAEAEFPFSRGGSAADPYAYQDYMFITDANDPGQYPPSDLGGDDWKYSSKNACQLYGNFDPRCNPAAVADPQELNQVTGASIDLAWETTTGRPDVVIAVHDSGVRWDDFGAMVDLNNKTWLNRGELPLPDHGGGHPNDAYDRNSDGIFNVRDYCADPAEESDCGGTGDSRVRGAAGSADTDYNANGWIDPEDLIFRFSDGVDDDGNGYTDDFAGWDTYEDDNDPFDEVAYGHGTGEARDSTAEVDNGGDAGVCPNCMVMHMRVGDSFIADTVGQLSRRLTHPSPSASLLPEAGVGSQGSGRPSPSPS